MKKLYMRLAAVLMAVGFGFLAPGPASAATSYCGLGWGSMAETVPTMKAETVTNVRTGQQYCFDRMVVDLSGPPTGYNVRYVPGVFRDGSGASVPLRGGAYLQVTVNAPSFSGGKLTYSPENPAELTNVTGFQTFRQVAWAGSFEGKTNIGLGVRARLPFRVMTLDGPGSGSRMVVDVAHFW